MEGQGYEKFNNLSANTNVVPASIATNVTEDNEHRRVRLLAVDKDNEKDHYFKVMNVTAIRRLIIVEAAASIIIVLCQIILYAAATPINGTYYYKEYKPLDIVGIAIWGPVLFFSVAAGLSWLTTKSPSSCSIGTAMAFQIISAVVALIMIIFAIISLTQYGAYRDCEYGEDNKYLCKTIDHQVPGRIFCSFILLSSGTVFVLSIFVSILFCRTGCCCRQKFEPSMIFAVETVT